MDEETLTRYATAYAVSPDDIRAWYESLDADTQPVVARCFARQAAPTPRDGDDWAQQYRLYYDAMGSFAAFVASRWTEFLSEVAS